MHPTLPATEIPAAAPPATFCEHYCRTHDIDRGAFHGHLLTKTLYPHARLVRPLLGWLRPDHFSVDLLYLDCLSRVRTLNQLDQESRDFKINSANRTALRNGLKFRISVARIHAIALPLLVPAKTSPISTNPIVPVAPHNLADHVRR